MDDAQDMRLGQTFADLFGDGDAFADRQLTGLTDETFQVLSGDVFHGAVVTAFVFSQVIHAADVLVGNLAGEGQLLPGCFHGLGGADV